ncbi:MAG TPA: hydantoinase/oxoprolinase family protein [Gemmataceae bacterium]|nr:hydantoinase/oxoprolinase family protein [Gemmataceae bacterium]
MPQQAIGLDIGGANLKAATVSGLAVTRRFELWKRPDRLSDELQVLAKELGPAEQVAVTMTGELCDCFATKRDGVRHILASVDRVFGAELARVWGTRGRFLSLDAAIADHLAVASANWHALATFAGRFAPQGFGLLVDVGSTTTDIIPLRDGLPQPVGRTDPERLVSGELVYTAVRRTPVCTVAGPDVAAEWFATTHDVYVRLGMLPEEPETRDTADGRPMTIPNAHARLSRMLGGDPEITPQAETDALAHTVFERQKDKIVRAIERIVNRHRGPPRIVIVSGSGEFLARAAAEAIAGNSENRIGPGMEHMRFVSLAERLTPAVSGAACAFAVAVLATEVPN